MQPRRSHERPQRSAVGVATVALAVPWLNDAITELKASVPIAEVAPALAWLLTHSDCANLDTPWRAWLLGQFQGGEDLLRLHPAGPTRRGIASEPVAQHARSSPEVAAATMQAASWACARPVHLAAGLDHLWLEPSLAPPLTAPEAREIVATLDAALVERGWSLMALDAERWLVGTRDAVECTTSTPLEAAGRAIRTHLPEGRDARLIRAVMTEMQMMLHEHPVNLRRSSAGQQAVNGVWLWGFGTLQAVAARSLPALATDDDWLRELWLLHGNAVAATTPDVLARSTEPAGTTLIALTAPPGVTSTERVQHSETTLFAPLRRALGAGDMTVCLNAGQSVYTLDRSRARSWRRWLPWGRKRT